MSLLENIRNIANTHKITIAELERATGLSNGTISKWDKSIPSINKVQAVADYFGVTLDYLMNGNEKSPLPEGNELSANESVLIQLFRSFPESEQRMLLDMIRAALTSKGLL